MSDLFTPTLPICKTVRIHFDGGTPCNNPTKGYGIGYGSFCFDGGEVIRVNHGIPCSNNAAEALTLLAALRKLAQQCNPPEIKVVIEGDSQIALNQVRRISLGRRGVKKTKRSLSGSDLYQRAICDLAGVLCLFGEVSAIWKPRVHAVRKFGH